MCNEYEHGRMFPKFERQIQTEGPTARQRWVAWSQHHYLPCWSQTLWAMLTSLGGWWLMSTCVYKYNPSRPICHFFQQFPSGRNLPGRLLWQLPCDQLLFGAHLLKQFQFWKKSQLKQWLLRVCTLGKLAGSGTVSSSINFNSFPSCGQKLSNSLALCRWAQSKLHDEFSFGCRLCVRDCIYVLCKELHCMKDKVMICMII